VRARAIPPTFWEGSFVLGRFGRRGLESMWDYRNTILVGVIGSFLFYFEGISILPFSYIDIDARFINLYASINKLKKIVFFVSIIYR
jgi:hypothetical protein